MLKSGHSPILSLSLCTFVFVCFWPLRPMRRPCIERRKEMVDRMGHNTTTTVASQQIIIAMKRRRKKEVRVSINDSESEGQYDSTGRGAGDNSQARRNKCVRYFIWNGYPPSESHVWRTRLRWLRHANDPLCPLCPVHSLQ